MLTRNSPQINDDYDLLPHQRAAVYAILEAEADYPTHRANTCIYSDKLGSGKTRVAIAVAAVAPMPAIFMPDRISDYIVVAENARFLPQSFYLVSTDVYDQWRVEISTGFPQLSCRYINTIRDLNKYLEVWQNCPDEIILLRHSKSTKLCEILAATVEFPYARVIVDDYDHIQRSILPRGISYIGISSTAKAGKSADSINPLRRGSILASSVVIRCAEEFLRESTTLPQYLYYEVAIKSSFGLAMCFKGVVRLQEFIEILSSDAHEKIEGMLGQVIKTPADLYRILMGSMYKRIDEIEETSSRLTSYTSAVVSLVKSGAAIRDITQDDIDEITNHVVRGTKILPTPLRGLGELSKRLTAEINAQKKAAGEELRVVREALSANICEVCHGPIGGDLNAIIVKCCNKIACINCSSTTWQKWKDTRCPFNATHLLKSADIVHISGKLSLEEIAASPIDSTKDLISAAPLEPQPQPQSQPTKISILISIIRGEQSAEPIEQKWDSLLCGNGIVYNNAPRKVLVFTREDESIKKISTELRLHGFVVYILQGNTFQIRKTLRTCREADGPLVLLINSTTHIHGYNAQFATDLVFYHRINDESIRAQTAGRIQRLGRVGSARIWQLLYIGE